MNILEEWADDSIPEAFFIKLGPVDSLRLILREVMDAAPRELVLLTILQGVRCT